MPKNKIKIPVHTMDDLFGEGIALAKATIAELSHYKSETQLHRDDYHLFCIQEKGNATIEIDFQKYECCEYTIAYIHPHQVHRVEGYEDVTIGVCAINSENINSELLQILTETAPLPPLIIHSDAFSIILNAFDLCLIISERRNDKFFKNILNYSCNAFIGLVISQYLVQYKQPENPNRYDVITKAFKTILNKNFITEKKPVDYASFLNLSVTYLNECIKNTTGFPISYHIQHRIVLEAKRQLYYTDKSVKEIAFELGYDDPAYFSRLFQKVAGLPALAFRTNNRV